MKLNRLFLKLQSLYYHWDGLRYNYRSKSSVEYLLQRLYPDYSVTQRAIRNRELGLTFL